MLEGALGEYLVAPLVVGIVLFLLGHFGAEWLQRNRLNVSQRPEAGHFSRAHRLIVSNGSKNLSDIAVTLYTGHRDARMRQYRISAKPSHAAVGDMRRDEFGNYNIRLVHLLRNAAATIEVRFDRPTDLRVFTARSEYRLDVTGVPVTREGTLLMLGYRRAMVLYVYFILNTILLISFVFYYGHNIRPTVGRLAEYYGTAVEAKDMVETRQPASERHISQEQSTSR